MIAYEARVYKYKNTKFCLPEYFSVIEISHN